MSGAPLQVAVVSSGDVSRGKEVTERRPHARVCLWGRGARAVASPLRAHALEGTCTRACMPERRQDDHPATPRPVSDDAP